MNASNEQKEPTSFDLSIIAYNDVLEEKDPQFTDNPIYMRHYRFWRSIANRPEDQEP